MEPAISISNSASFIRAYSIFKSKWIKNDYFPLPFVLNLELQISRLLLLSRTICDVFTYADDTALTASQNFAAHHHLMLLTSSECNAASKMRGKMHQSCSNKYHITSIWCNHSPNVKSSPFNLHHVSLQEFNSDRPQLTSLGFWSACGSLGFTCLWIPAKQIFIKDWDPTCAGRQEEGAGFALRPRYQTRRGGWGGGVGRRKVVCHTSTPWSRRIPGELQPLRSVLCWAGSFLQPPAASCSLPQPISLNVLQMYVRVSGPEMCSAIQQPQCISSVWEQRVTKQNRLWKIALPQRKLLKWPLPNPPSLRIPNPLLPTTFTNPSSLK